MRHKKVSSFMSRGLKETQKDLERVVVALS